MQYEHLVQINDLDDARIEPLTRDQLWRGLVARAERPQHFTIGMDECRIVERAPNMLRRHMRFGDVQVRDCVTYQPQQQMQFDVEPSDVVAAAQLIIQIEEPQPGALFLRFRYAFRAVAEDAVGEFDEYRKSAYRDADIDTVRLIRELAATGVLSSEWLES